jgi:membrane fusion protein, copper/silver efflux system
MNPVTRTVRVRVEVGNGTGFLKPEMFVNGIVHSTLDTKGQLAVPKSAILWTGRNSVVYVKDNSAAQPTFKKRYVLLGPETNDFYIIANGLKEGEDVVSHGAFVVDAAAQLSGKPSMMNTEPQ